MCVLLMMLSSGSKVLCSKEILLDHCEADEGACDATTKSKEEEACVDLDLGSMLSDDGRDWPTVAVIEAKGRLGNHLIAFTLIGALAKQLGFQPYIMEETYEYSSSYISTYTTTYLLQWNTHICITLVLANLMLKSVRCKYQ